MRMLFLHAQDDLNLRIMRMFEDTFSLDAAQMDVCLLKMKKR